VMALKKFLYGILLMLFCALCCPGKASAETDGAADQIGEKTKDAVILLLLQPQIKAAVNTYYSEYITGNPNTELFYTDIAGIEKSDPAPNDGAYAWYNITVEVMPYIGAHNVIGKDRITVTVDVNGNAGVINFKHLESYDISQYYNVQGRYAGLIEYKGASLIQTTISRSSPRSNRLSGS